jgi:hypothetical protein
MTAKLALSNRHSLLRFSRGKLCVGFIQQSEEFAQLFGNLF